MAYRKVWALAVGLSLLLVPSLALADGVPVKAIIGGTLVDLDGGTPLSNAVVLIKGERITAVGRADTLAVPAGAEVVRAEGKWLLPGLINMHVHLDLVLPGATAAELMHETEAELALRVAENARKSLLSGTTTIRTTGAFAFSGEKEPGLGDRYPDLAAAKAIARGAAIGPRIYSAGVPIAPTGGHSSGPLIDGADGPYEVTKAVRRQILAGATWIKLMITKGLADPHGAITASDMTLDEMRAAVDTAHRQGVRVTAHTGSPEATLEALEAGVDSFEHGYFLSEQTFREMKKRGAWYVPTIVVSQQGALEFFEKIGSPQWYLERAKSVGTDHWRALQTAIRLGVNIAMGSDQFPFEPNGGTVASVRETELYVEAGMTPLEALRAATIKPAIMLGADKDLGSIAPGKYADIIMVTGDPTADISALRTIGFVMKGGEIVRNDGGPNSSTGERD